MPPRLTMDYSSDDFDSELYVDSELSHLVAERLYEMQRSGMMCDATLVLRRIDDPSALHSLSLHRCVLAASSPAFCALLGESRTPEVAVTVGNIFAVESLVEYMYAGRLRVCLAFARDLLKLGRDYAIGNVVCLVEQHLSNSLSLSSWIRIFRIADEFQLTSIIQKTTEFIASNVDEVLEGKTDFEHMHYDILRRILIGCESPDSWKWQVRLILRWCERRYGDRVDRVEGLLDLVNFEGVDAVLLRQKLGDDSAQKSNNALRFAIHACLSRAGNSAVKTDSTLLGRGDELAGESVDRNLHMVSKLDENDAERFTNLTEKVKIDSEGQTSESGRKCNRHSSKRKDLLNQIVAISKSVGISSTQKADDREKKLLSRSCVDKLIESCAEKSNNLITFGEHPITLKSGILSGGNALSSRTSLRNQNVLSFSKRPNSTAVCGGDLKRLRSIRGKRARTVEEMLRCPLCPKEFATPSDQRRHIEGHGSETPLACDVCGFTTRHRSSMNVHKQIHFGKRLKCLYEGCTYSAIRYADIEDHHNHHNGIKSHVCSVCGKAFSSRRHHARHEKIHSSVKNFACSECEYRSGRSDKLRDHERKHHREKTAVDGKKSTDGVESKTGNSKQRKTTKDKVSNRKIS